MKMRRSSIIFMIVLVLIVLNMSNLMAIKLTHAVCGKVNDSYDGTSASWYVVYVYPQDEKESYTTCEISPADNKYCCDIGAIASYEWKINDTFIAEVIDTEDGYIAGPVNVTITGAGYDVFPEMQLKPVINIHSPKNKIYLNNSIFINITTKNPYVLINFTLNLSGNLTIYELNNYTNLTLLLNNLSYGQYELTVYASLPQSHDVIFRKSISFALLKNIEFDRSLVCDHCTDVVIPSNESVTIIIYVNLSDPLHNFYLFDYYPNEWLLEDSNEGILNKYSESHNIIKWKVSGNNISKNYTLKSPLIFFPKKYYFKAAIDGIESKNYSVIVRKFPFFTRRHKYKTATYSNKDSYFVGKPDRAIVVKWKNESNIITKIIITPNKKIRRIWINVRTSNVNPTNTKINDIYTYLYVDSNIKREDVNNMIIEFRVKKSWLDKHSYSDVILLHYNHSVWSSLHTTKYSEDEKYVYYRATTSSFSLFAVMGKKIYHGKKIMGKENKKESINKAQQKVYGDIELSDKNIFGNMIGYVIKINRNKRPKSEYLILLLAIVLFFYLFVKSKK